MDSGSSCDDDWEKLMGRLDGSGSLVDGREMNTVSVNVTFGVVGLLRSFDSWIVRVSCFLLG